MKAGFRRFMAVKLMLGFSVIAISGNLEGAVSAAWEQYATQKHADQWLVYDWGREEFYLPAWDATAGEEHIWFYHEGDAVLEFSADVNTARGAYTGDFLAANVDSITVDLFIEDIDEFAKVDCGIFTRGPDGVKRWYYSVPYTWADFSADGWQRFVRFGMEETWTHFDGPQPVTILADETFLRSVESVAITFFPVTGSNANIRVGLDNFVLEPKVVAPKLDVSHTTSEFKIEFTPAPGLSADLQRMATTEPFAWSDVNGQTFITGPSRHRFTTPITDKVEIFRVAVFPDYFPITVD